MVVERKDCLIVVFGVILCLVSVCLAYFQWIKCFMCPCVIVGLAIVFFVQLILLFGHCDECKPCIVSVRCVTRINGTSIFV